MKPSRLLGAFVCFALSFHAAAQCNNPTSYGGGVAPTAGNTTTLTTCQWAGEYATVTGVAATTQYQSTSDIATDFITVRQGTSGGMLIASGTTPLNWTSTVAGNYYIHCNTNAACGTATICRTTTLVNTVPMTYGHAAGTQPSSSIATKCVLSGKEMMGIQVVMNGSLAPMNITQISLRPFQCTAALADVATVHIYHTGTSNVFATTNQFGATMPMVNNGAPITFTDTRTLVNGTNYFWVAFDLTPGATVGHYLDVQCQNVIVDGAPHGLINANPAGKTIIAICPPTPGGVANNLSIWLRSDLGVTTSGVNVTGWANQGDPNITTTQYGSPDLAPVGRNYNPIINFTLSNGTATGGDYLLTNSTMNIQSMFCTGQVRDIYRANTHIATYASVTLGQPCGGCAIHGGGQDYGAPLRARYSEYDYGNQNFQGAGIWRRNGDPSGLDYYTIHSANFDIVTALGRGTGSVNALLGGQIDNYPFNGRLRDWFGPVGELILYSGPITLAEAARVESYLAIKYGITLGGNGSTSLAYKSSTGATVWVANPAPPNNYHNDVIGIGRDDNGGLLQKQSHTPDDTTRIFLSTLVASNQLNAGSFANDRAFVMVGHNKGKVCATVASAAEMPASVYSRLEREWKVVNTGFGGAFNFSVKLNACAAPSSVNFNDLRLLVDLDGNFTNATVHAAGGGLSFSYTGGYITVTGIGNTEIPQNSTRYITIASADPATPLPIELVAFDAECNGTTVAVSWTTASEWNNAFFTVEMSTDGVEYHAVTSMDGMGTSNTMHHYAWADGAPVNGLSYYRLKQTDLDGGYTYSNAVPVHCGSVQDFSIFPNPANDGFSFITPPRFNEAALTVELRNVTGQLVWGHTYSGPDPDPSRTDVSLDGVSEGIYFVTFLQPGGSRTFKLSVVR